MKVLRFDYLTPLALTAMVCLALISIYEWVDEIFWPGVNVQQHRFHFGVFVTFISCVAVFFIVRLLKTHSVMTSIVESSEDGIIGKDLHGKITSWNAGAQRIYGYSLEEVQGQSISILTPPGMPDDLGEILERIRNGEPVRHLETVRMRKDGELIDVSLTISPIKTPAGIVTGASTFVRDISERKRMEQELRRSEEKYRLLVETMSEGLAANDDQAAITFVNNKFCELVGYSREELIGHSATMLLDEENLRIASSEWKAREKGNAAPYEIALTRKDGKKVHTLVAPMPVFDENLQYRGSFGVFTDITDRKFMEEELRRAKDSLEMEVRKRTAELEETNEQLRGEIQERRHAQEALQKERDKFMGILESMGDGVYIASRDHRMEYLNPVIENEFGPVTAGKCYEYFEGRTAECPRCKNQEVFSGKTVRWEWASTKTHKTYDSFATPIVNSDGTISKLEIFRDITEQKQAEHALRESEERYRMLFNEANDAIFVVEVTPNGEYGRFVDFNVNLCGLLGYTREELKELMPLDLIAPEFVDDIREKKRELLENRHLLAERAFSGKDGRRVPVEISSHVFDYKGQPTVLAIARDITERKRSEEILRASEIKYRKLSQEFDTLLNAIGDTLVLISPDMQIRWANNATTFEIDEIGGDMTGQYYHSMFCDRSAPCDDCSVIKCLRTGSVESHISSKGGRFLDKRAFPVKDGDGVTGVLLHIVDITEKMAVQAEGMQANHLASLGELAAGVAHEINNPINGIINYGQVLINESGAESLGRDIGSRIVKEGERVANIVKSLLSFARGGREDKQPIGIGAVLTESLILTQAQIRKEGIMLDIHVPDDLPKVQANPQGMQQVFLNIINNARYALNEKYPTRDENKVIEIVGEAICVQDREYVRMTFADRGVGIPADDLPILTKPFFSTKPFGKGTGLGLAISERIIAEHGGRLAFESEEGEYAKVIVDLPAKAP
jgi:PAS domain S-box-containing protein